MDTPTQALLGAVVGQAFFARKLGRRALLWGAVAGVVPDLDLFPAELLSPWGEFLYHRGPTHSLFFGLAAGPVFGYLVWKAHARKRLRTEAVALESSPEPVPGGDGTRPGRPLPRAGAKPVAGEAGRQGRRDGPTSRGMPMPGHGGGAEETSGLPAFRASVVGGKGSTRGIGGLPEPGAPGMFRVWAGLFLLGFLTHPLLDLFTSYGTQLLWPLSRRRFALQGVAIIDPCYSLILVAALLLWLLAPAGRKIAVGRGAALGALALSTLYLFFGLWLGSRAEAEVRRQLAAEGIVQAGVRCYPTLFQPFLRRVVVRSESEVRVGMLTLWKPCAIKWGKFEVIRDPRVEKLLATQEGRIFAWFAMGEISGRVIPAGAGSRVEIDDLRYGFFEVPEHGLWGIAARFDAQGNRVSEVRRFRRPYPQVRETLARLWRETWGASCGN